MAAGYRLFIKFPKFREAEKQENKNLIIIIYYRSSVICTADFVILEHFYKKKNKRVKSKYVFRYSYSVLLLCSH